MIELIKLTHCYQTRDKAITALNGINLTFPEGEFTVILGRNGSGKSTLAKHLNGLLLPTEGEVKIGGLKTTKPEDLPFIRRQVGLVFQNPDNQIIATMVEEDVAFGPENLGLPRHQIRQRVDEALSLVGMEGFARREPHLLSAGQKQKVVIAGILAMRPQYLVLDEPTAMLDPSGRRSILRTIHALHREHKMTVIHITHFIEEALEADRVIVLDRGKIVFDGQPETILTDAVRLAQAGLSVPPMVKLAGLLSRSAIKLSNIPISVEEMTEAL